MTISLALLLKAMWTGLGGAVGAGARHLLATHSRKIYGDHFPWGTLFINLTGAFAIGGVTGVLSAHQGLQHWHGLLVVGFLGGYTTFSTLMLEGARLRARADHHLLVLYLFVSVVAGMLLTVAGLALGRWL